MGNLHRDLYDPESWRPYLQEQRTSAVVTRSLPSDQLGHASTFAAAAYHHQFTSPHQEE